jgi:hypothetical protein
MNARLFVVVASCAVALPAVAGSGFTPGKGESSGSYHWMPSTRTVEQVSAELAAWRRNPVTADGLRQVNGDPGWVYIGTGATGMTRSQVQQELAEFRRNPVTADGLTFMAGEAGWVEAGIAQQAGAIARSAVRSTAPMTIGQRPIR